nr:14133_t:CDS:2 [Entrophospora candida]
MYLLRRAVITHSQLVNSSIKNPELPTNIQVNFKHGLASIRTKPEQVLNSPIVDHELDYEKFLNNINEKDSHNEFCRNFGIKFSDKKLMHQVCIHKSFKLVDQPTSERLNFLGKKVIELYSTDYFLKKYEDEDLSAAKLKGMVREYTDKSYIKLGTIGMKLGLNKLMYWTPQINHKKSKKSEEITNLTSSPPGELKVVGKVLLAFVGAIYHDKGALAARKFINKNILAVKEEK